MPVFEYAARDNAGKLIKGKISAESIEAAETRISNMGHIVISITSDVKGIFKKDIFESFKGVKLRDHAFLAIQLSNALKVGMPLLRVVDSIAAQTKNEKLKLALKEVCQDLKAGNSFSESLRRHPKIFSRYFVSMVQTGEATGKLDDALGRLSTNIEKELDTRQKITSSLSYPAVLALVAISVVIFLMVGIMPKFVNIFLEAKVPLPKPTQVLLAISGFLQRYWLYGIAGLFFLIQFYRRYRKSSHGKYVTDHLYLKIPVVGGLIKKICVARFIRVFSTLYGSGVPILNSLAVLRETERNAVFSEAIKKIEAAVKEGKTITDPLRNSNLFTPDAVSMIDFGEESGKLGDMLDRLADIYDQEIDYAVKSLTSLFEPLIIVVMGSMIGFIALSIMMPMMRMTQLAYK